MANRETTITFTADKGRYGRGREMEIPEGFCAEAENVEFWQSALGRRRPGTYHYTSPGSNPPSCGRLFRYCVNTDAVWDVFTVDTTATTANLYKTSHTAIWTNYAAIDITNPTAFDARVLNGKIFLCGNSTKLYCFDGTVARQVGINQSAAPTAADTGGAGTYSGVRYYQVAFVVVSGSTVIRRSELSPVLTWTPDGAHASVTVTKPTTPAGTSTHWEVYGSPNGMSYYLLAAPIVLATTTYVDTTPPANYTGNQPPVVGDNTLPKPWKSVGRDGNRLLGVGSWNAADPQSRLWYTPVLGASGVGNDERVPSNNYLDINESDGDFCVAVTDNIDGVFYVFKRRHIYKVVPTGDATNPYVWREVSNSIGVASAAYVAEGEDANGNACCYFGAGPQVYRLGIGGLQEIGENVRDLVVGGVSPLMYYPMKRQMLFLYVTGVLVYHVETAAWAKWTGNLGTKTRGACMLGTFTPTAFAPYFGWDNGSIEVLDVGHTISNEKDGETVAFSATVTLPTRAPFGLLHKVETHDPALCAAALAATSVKVTVTGDFGIDSANADVSLAPAASETRIIRQAEGARLGNVTAVQFSVADVAGQSKAWSLDAVQVEVLEKEGL